MPKAVRQPMNQRHVLPPYIINIYYPHNLYKQKLHNTEFFSENNSNEKFI